MYWWLFHGVLQLLDGVLTYAGVTSLGLEAEGNPLLRYFMAQAGPAEALIYVKSATLAMSLFFSTQASREVMLRCALPIVNFIYTVSAAGWIYTLYI